MKSHQILNICNTAQTFGITPSVLLKIDDDYAAYCFDEACAYIIGQLKQDKTPRFEEDESLVKKNPLLQQLMGKG